MKIIKIIIIAVFLKQLLWVIFIPMWQFPDEQAHFADVQKYAENNFIKTDIRSSTSREIFESEKLLGTARDWAGNNQFTHNNKYNISYTENKNGFFENEIKNMPFNYRKELVINEATGYPGLYYQFAGIFYKLAYQNNLIDRLFVSRLNNIFLYLCTIYVVWKIGEILFKKDYLLRATYITMVAFHPMLSFVYGGINSDNLFILLFSIAIYINLLIVNKGWKFRYLLSYFITLYLGLITKPQAPLIALCCIYPFVYSLINSKNKLLPILVFMVLLYVGLKYFLFGIINNVQFLPNIALLEDIFQNKSPSWPGYFKTTLIHTYREVIPWYWGVFRWLSLTYPRFVHRILNWLTVIGVAGLVFFIKNTIVSDKNNKFKNKLWLNTGFLIYVSIMYYLSLFVYDFLFIRTRGFSLGVQGRYYLPAVAAHMAILLIGLNTLIPVKYKNLILKIVASGFIILHTYAFYLVVSSFYSLVNIKTFFIQASQYKPDFLKSPVSETVIILFVVSLLFLIFKLYSIKTKKIKF